MDNSGIGKVRLDNRRHAIIATMVFAVSLVIMLIVGATGPDVLIMHEGSGDRVFPIEEGTDHASYYCRVVNMRPENQLVWCALGARSPRARARRRRAGDAHTRLSSLSPGSKSKWRAWPPRRTRGARTTRSRSRCGWKSPATRRLRRTG